MTRAQLKSFRSVSPPHFACIATTPAPHATGTQQSGGHPGAGPAPELQPQRPADLPRAPRGITVVGGALAVGAASGWRSPLGRAVAREPRAGAEGTRRRGSGARETAGVGAAITLGCRALDSCGGCGARGPSPCTPSWCAMRIAASTPRSPGCCWPPATGRGCGGTTPGST